MRIELLVRSCSLVLRLSLVLRWWSLVLFLTVGLNALGVRWSMIGVVVVYHALVVRWTMELTGALVGTIWLVGTVLLLLVLTWLLLLEVYLLRDLSMLRELSIQRELALALSLLHVSTLLSEVTMSRELTTVLKLALTWVSWVLLRMNLLVQSLERVARTMGLLLSWVLLLLLSLVLLLRLLHVSHTHTIMLPMRTTKTTRSRHQMLSHRATRLRRMFRVLNHPRSLESRRRRVEEHLWMRLVRVLVSHDDWLSNVDVGISDDEDGMCR